MKYISLLLLCVSVSLSAQIPNSDFEQWDNQPVLLQWHTNSRPLTLPAFNPYVVVKDTDAYSGTYSANFIGNGVFHSVGSTTFAVNARPLSLSLQYKLMFPACVNDTGYPEKDTVSVLVEVLKGTSVVDYGYREFTKNNVLQWTSLTIPVSTNALQFDSCRITITGGKVYGGCGIVASATEFKVDHLTLKTESACTTKGVVVQGFSCLLIDTGTANLLMPCNISLSAQGVNAGDSIRFSFTGNACVSICQQGTGVDITCLDTGTIAAPVCNASVSFQKQNPTSHPASNGKIKAVVNAATAPLQFNWSNAEAGIGLDSIDSLTEGLYCVTITDANNCSAFYCDSLMGASVCRDSFLICPTGSLCCDAPLVDPVCGCDSVTYTNGCIATYWNGVTSFYSGPCLTTSVNNKEDVASGLMLSPVPAKNNLQVTYSLRAAGNTQISVTDILGRLVKSSNRTYEVPGLYKLSIEISNLKAGVYFIEVKTETERKVKRFVVE